MEAEISQGCPKSLPPTEMRHRNPWGPKEESGGTKFKFGQLIIRKIIKIVATRFHILRPNAPNSISVPRPHSALSALPQTP